MLRNTSSAPASPEQAEAEAALASVTAEVNRLQQESEGIIANNRRMEEDHAKRRDEIEAQISEINQNKIEAELRLAQTLKDLEDRAAMLIVDIASSEEVKKSLKHDVDVLSEEVGKVTRDLENKREEAEKVTKQLAELNEAKAVVSADLDVLNHTHVGVGESLAKTKIAVAEAETEHSKLQEAISTAQERAEEAEKAADAASLLVDDAQDEIEKLEDKKADLKVAVASLEQEVEEKKEWLVKEDARITERQRALALLEQTIDAKADKLKRMGDKEAVNNVAAEKGL